MYIFEFSHTFDKDDLSYMWQNIMPRNYEKFEIKSSTFSHNLDFNEIMEPNDLLDNDNVRWQVFKVKQRVESNYYDKKARTVAPIVQSTAATSAVSDFDKYVNYNWPYDFFSIVEGIKIDAQVLMDTEEYTTSSTNQSGAPANSGGTTSNGNTIAGNSGNSSTTTTTTAQSVTTSQSSIAGPTTIPGVDY